MKSQSREAGVKPTRHLMWAFLLCVFALSGCTLFGPTDTTPLKEATAEQLTALLQEQAGEVRTIKGLFSAKITGGILPIGQRVQGTVFFSGPMPSGCGVSRLWAAKYSSSSNWMINSSCGSRRWGVK